MKFRTEAAAEILDSNAPDQITRDLEIGQHRLMLTPLGISQLLAWAAQNPGDARRVADMIKNTL